MSDTGTAAAAAAAAAQAPWFGTITPDAAGFAAGDVGKSEFTGYITNRGYDKMEPGAAFAAAVKAHRAAEAHLGAPADQLLRMPKDAADAEGWTRFDQRVGVPTDAKEYDFSTVKVGDKDIDPALAEALRPALKASHVGKTEATAVAKAVADYLGKTATTKAADDQAAINSEREALKINWGSNVEANLLVAKAAAKALNVDEAAVAALEKTIGYAKTMEMFRNIGSRIGEDTFITNGAPGGTGIMSGDQAAATLAERRADTAWAQKLMAGDATTVREFNNLTTVINAAQQAARRA